MKRASVVVFFVLAGCNNFDALVERCVADGRCGESGAPPELSAQPTMLSFSLVAGEVIDPRRVTIQNVNGGLATSLTPTLTGPDADEFRFDNKCGATLATSQSCIIDVSFVPTAALGPRLAALEVRGALGAPVVINLAGDVNAPLDVASSLDFGDVAVGVTRVLPLQVINNAGKPASVVPSFAPPFSVASDGNGCAVVGAMQACTIQVRFTAPAAGELQGTLLLGLSGTAASQAVSLSGRSVTPGQLAVSMPLLPAGSQVLGFGNFVDSTFTVSNVGTQRINAIAYELIADAGAFELLDAGCYALDAGASCQGLLRFAPNAYGYYPVTLSVDAGPIGGAVVSDLARATGTMTVNLNVGPSYNHAGVTQSLDGGRCEGACSYSVFADPASPTTFTVTPRPTVLVPNATVTGACTSFPCDVVIDGNKTINVTTHARSVGFVTNTTYQCSFGGLDAGDAICNAHARDAGLPGDFKVLVGLSDGGGGFTRFPEGDLIVNVDGGALVNLGLGLGARLSSGWRTERGVLLSNTAEVFTGLDQQGNNYAGLTCNDWTVANNTSTYAEPNGTSQSWFYHSTYTNSAQLFCISTGTVSPQPDAGVFMFVAAANVNTAPITLPDGGAGRSNAPFNQACGVAAEALGFQRDSAMAYLTSYASATQLAQAFDGGEPGPLYRLDGQRLTNNWRFITSDWDAGVPVTFGYIDGGVRVARMPITTSSHYLNYAGSYDRPSLYSATNPSCAAFSAMSPPTSSYSGGSALSVTNWWGGTNSFSTTCGAPRWVYCLAVK